MNLDELQVETEKLLSLLKDRQEGLISWNMFLFERLKNIAKYVQPTEGEVIPDYGEVITKEEFYEWCKDGVVANDDGSGYYSDRVWMYRYKPAYPAVVAMEGPDPQPEYSHVVWFNK